MGSLSAKLRTQWTGYTSSRPDGRTTLYVHTPRRSDRVPVSLARVHAYHAERDRLAKAVIQSKRREGAATNKAQLSRRITSTAYLEELASVDRFVWSQHRNGTWSIP